MPTPGRAATARGITAPILSTAALTFLCYLAIGLPLAVLPGYVHDRLGYGTTTAGLAISVQYAATLVSRPQAGRMADAAGPKLTSLCGLLAAALSGGLLLLSLMLAAHAGASLLVLIASRLVLGFGESWVGTGALAWGIARVGAENTARMIAWNGAASYGALALGAPAGVAVVRGGGMLSLGLVIAGVGALGFVSALGKPAVAVVQGRRMAWRRVFWRMLPYGLGLGLGSVGFGTIATFITLFFATRGWNGAAAALSLFGLGFAGARLMPGNPVGRFGGFPVAFACFGTEAVGLLLLAAAGAPGLAFLGAALAGFGFSLVFPALGVEAMGRVPAQNRGAALGAYTVFLDLALGVTGPVAGLIVGRLGYSAAFLFAAAAAASGIALTAALRARRAPLAAGV